MKKSITNKKRANPETVAFTAGNAKPGRMHNRKAHQRLQERQKDYELFMAKRDGELSSGVAKRRAGGGFHKPGSNQ